MQEQIKTNSHLVLWSCSNWKKVLQFIQINVNYAVNEKDKVSFNFFFIKWGIYWFTNFLRILQLINLFRMKTNFG